MYFGWHLHCSLDPAQWPWPWLLGTRAWQTIPWWRCSKGSKTWKKRQPSGPRTRTTKHVISTSQTVKSGRHVSIAKINRPLVRQGGGLTSFCWTSLSTNAFISGLLLVLPISCLKKNEGLQRVTLQNFCSGKRPFLNTNTPPAETDRQTNATVAVLYFRTKNEWRVQIETDACRIQSKIARNSRSYTGRLGRW